jgi:hypothetical protein
MVTFPGSAKGHLDTGHLGEASMTLLSSRRKGAAGAAEWGSSERSDNLYILSSEARERGGSAAVLSLIGYTELLPVGGLG